MRRSTTFFALILGVLFTGCLIFYSSNVQSQNRRSYRAVSQKKGNAKGRATTRRAPQQKSQRAAQSNQADGVLHIDKGALTVNGGLYFQPYSCSFKKNVKTPEGPATLDYSYYIEWPLITDATIKYEKKIDAIRRVIAERIFQEKDSTFCDIFLVTEDGYEGDKRLYNDIIWCLKTRTTHFWDRCDKDNVFTADDVKNNLKITCSPISNEVIIKITDSYTDRNGKTTTNNDKIRVIGNDNNIRVINAGNY